MIKIKIIATGDKKDKNINAICDEFKKRLSRWCSVEIDYVSEFLIKTDAQIPLQKKKEAETQIAKFDGFVIALDKAGKTYSSEDFAKYLDGLFVNGNSTLTFVIGGSNGLDESVLNKANEKLSFGPLTLPHELARVVLLEQIYRAFSILNNTPYHK